MKKLTFLYLTICAFFIFNLGFSMFDRYVDYTYHIELENSENINIMTDLDADTFYQLLVKYNLECVRTDTDSTTQAKTLFVHIENSALLDSIMTTNGRLSTISKNDVYDSQSTDPSYRLLNPIPKDRYMVKSMAQLDSVSGSYDVAGTQIEAFKTELKALGTNTIITVDYNNVSHYDVTLFGLLRGNLISILCMAVTTIIFCQLLNINLIMKSKRTQLMKLEGRSVLSIYVDFLLKNLFIAVVIQGFIYLALSSIYIHSVPANWAMLWLYLLTLEGIFLLLLLLSSALVLFTISAVSANLSIKGKLKFKKIQWINYGLKMILLCLSVVVFATFFTGIHKTLLLKQEKSFYEQTTKNLYYTGSSPYFLFNDIYSESFKQTYIDFVEEMNMFPYYPITINKIDPQVIKTSVLYLEQNGLVAAGEITRNDNCVYVIPKTIKNSDEVIYYLNQYFYTDSAQIIYFENSVRLPKLNMLEFKGQNTKPELSPIYVVYPPDNQMGSYLYVEAQDEATLEAKTKEIFRRNGLPEDFFEFQNVYESVYSETLRRDLIEIKFLLPLVSVLIVTLIVNELQLVTIDQTLNRKRYALMMIEGRSSWALIYNYLMIQLVLLLIFNTLAIYVLQLEIQIGIVMTLLYFMLSCFVSIIAACHVSKEVNE